MSSAVTRGSDPQRSSISVRKIAMGTVAAIVTASVANAIIYFIADALGAMPDNVTIETMTGGTSNISMVEIVTSIAFSLVMGGIVFAVIARFSRNSIRVFWIVAAIALVITFYPPFTLKGAPGDMIASLLIMHVATAMVGVVVMTRVASS